MLLFLSEVTAMQMDYMCGAMIKQIHDEIEKVSNRLLQLQRLTTAQMNVLMELNSAERSTLSLKELEGILYVAQSTTAGIVVRLKQKGFVESFGDKRDRRIKNVRITDAGRACCLNAKPLLMDTQTSSF